MCDAKVEMLDCFLICKDQSRNIKIVWKVSSLAFIRIVKELLRSLLLVLKLKGAILNLSVHLHLLVNFLPHHVKRYWGHMASMAPS